MNNGQLKELVDELLKHGKELSWLEFKRNDATDHQRLGKYISGLANAANVAHELFGYLIFGIDDITLEVVGSNFNYSNRKEKGNELDFYIRRNLTACAGFEYFTCDYNGKQVEIFQIPAAGTTPVAFENEEYIRIGSHLTILKKYPDLLRAILNSHIDWSAQVNMNARIEDLDTDAIALARRKFSNKNIHKMFNSQRNRFFPLPDYTKSSLNEVILEIYGHTIDENYSKTLIERNNELSLTEVILLDKVQKQQPINDDDAKILKKKNLIEGRKPNYYIGAKIAKTTGYKAEYTKNKGLDKQYYLDLIIKAIEQHGNVTRNDIDKLLWNKLPEILDERQKKNMIGYLITELRMKEVIINSGTYKNPEWKLKI